MKKPIFTFLGSNYQAQDIRLACWLLLQPWKWKRGQQGRKLERLFEEYFDAQKAIAVSSGRDALFCILQALKLEKDDEVLLQAYTCAVVPNAILAVNAKPIYVDVQEHSYNMDPEDLAQKITPKSKALIIQHTFGRPAEINALLTIAKRHNIVVIEDCAHALGAKYNNLPVGSFGDVSFFSFGRNKPISAVFGGMIVINKNHSFFQSQQAPPKYPSYIWILQQLLYPIIIFFAKLTYNIGIGKVCLKLCQKMHILSKDVSKLERQAKMPSFVSSKMPNALAALALAQFSRLQKFNEHRKEIARFYNWSLGRSTIPGHSYFLYSLLVDNPKKILKDMKAENIFLGDWYSQPIAPYGVDYKAVGYKAGSCLVAESLAQKSINLPTHIHICLEDAQRIISILKNAYPKYKG